MTALLEKTTDQPCVSVGILTDLHDRTGGCIRRAAAGEIVRIDDGSAREVACMLIGPPHMRAVLAFLGLDPDAALANPGGIRDAL